VLRLLRSRNHVYNDGVRRIARRYDATLVDYWSFDAYQDPRMWAPDRLRMSKAGQKYLAARVLEVLDVPHSITSKPWETIVPRTLREWEREHRRWMLDWVLPLAVRKVRRVTLGDTLQPRWPTPVPVPPRGGLRKLAKENPRRKPGVFSCGRYWDRTSDLFRVREARYRCANRPNPCKLLTKSRWIRDSNPCIRLCRPLPRLSANPPCWVHHQMKRTAPLGAIPFERMTRFELATLTLAR
jgi:hypothetical protein